MVHWYLQWEIHPRLCSTCAQKRAAAGQHITIAGITGEMISVKCCSNLIYIYARVLL